MPYVRNHGYRVRYETAGDRRKRSILLIFGFSMTCEDWEELGYIAALTDDFHVVCVEPRGHGQSASPTDPADYALDAMASDVEAVVAALGLAKPILWGYSLGAKIALAAAGRNPACCSGLVLGGFELSSEVNLPNDPVAQALERGSLAWLALWRQMFEVPRGMAARLACANAEALLAIRQAEGRWPLAVTRTGARARRCVGPALCGRRVLLSGCDRGGRERNGASAIYRAGGAKSL